MTQILYKIDLNKKLFMTYLKFIHSVFIYTNPMQILKKKQNNYEKRALDSILNIVWVIRPTGESPSRIGQEMLPSRKLEKAGAQMLELVMVVF